MIRDASVLCTFDRSDFARNVFTRAHYHCAPSTVPIAGWKDGQFVFDRCGLLLRVADRHFLITAKHGTSKDNTIGDALDAGYRLFVLGEFPNGVHIGFGFERLWISTERGADVAVFALDEDSAAQLEKENYRFLNLADIASRDAVAKEPSLYLVCGYPSATEDKKVTPDGIKKTVDFIKYMMRDSRMEIPQEVDPRMHLYLSYGKSAFNPEGVQAETLNPKGLSGCGIWYVCPINRYGFWIPEDMKLVGIQGSWFSKTGCLKGTWIDTPVAMIWRKYPVLREAIRFVGIEY